MDLLQKSKIIKFRSHNDKYLVADDDQETVRQSRNGNSDKARWFVETVEGKSGVVVFRSCHGTYLTASDDSFLLGMTGKKVTQSSPEKISGEWNIQWEPVRDGFQVRFKSWCGKFLRANGGTPPWRNSITHDDPHTTSTKNWILWDVEVAGQTAELDRFSDSNLSYMSSFDVSDDVLGSVGSMDVANVKMVSRKSSKQDFGQQSGVKRFSARTKHNLLAQMWRASQVTVQQARRREWSMYGSSKVRFVEIDFSKVIAPIHRKPTTVKPKIVHINILISRYQISTWKLRLLLDS